MFLSGTHSAASAQPMRSRPVFKIRSNSSASPVGSLIGGHLQHQFDRSRSRTSEIALAGAELGAQRQLAAQALERRLHQLPHGTAAGAPRSACPTAARPD